jgi:hypothetical protein
MPQCGRPEPSDSGRRSSDKATPVMMFSLLCERLTRLEHSIPGRLSPSEARIICHLLSDGNLPRFSD